MSRPERRVAIAKDVLSQIHTRKIKVKTGFYLHPVKVRVESSRNEQIREIKKKCSACARGSMMLCRLGYDTKHDLQDIVIGGGSFMGYVKANRSDTSDILSDAFTERQLNTIENAFECDLVIEEFKGQNVYMYSHLKPKDRLIAIMQNIIDHNGEYKHDVEYEVVWSE